MQVFIKQKTSITGRVHDKRVGFKISRLPALYIVPSEQRPGEWFTRFGDAHTRYELKKWLVEEFGTEKPPFDTIYERVMAINPPAPLNTKGRTWLK